MIYWEMTIIHNLPFLDLRALVLTHFTIIFNIQYYYLSRANHL